MAADRNPTASGYAATSSDTPKTQDKYLQKLSGPLLDRIDIHVEVPAVPYRELSQHHPKSEPAAHGRAA